jgi:hypothetical protein
MNRALAVLLCASLLSGGCHTMHALSVPTDPAARPVGPGAIQSGDRLHIVWHDGRDEWVTVERPSEGGFYTTMDNRPYQYRDIARIDRQSLDKGRTTMAAIAAVAAAVGVIWVFSANFFIGPGFIFVSS